jgi:galactokinase
MNDPLLQRVAATFARHFDAPPTLVVRAPGRVNLIGEHTDYNDGFVLPCAIDYQTLVAVRPRSDRTVRVVAADAGDAIDEFRLDHAITQRTDAPWANYVRGVAVMLQERGLVLRGAEMAIAGNVPQGAGLSSSAALEVAVAQAFKSLHGLNDLSLTDLALIAQRAENRFVGCQCGVMDQLISARGEQGHALLIDCRSLHTQAVPLPEDLAVVIVESRVTRGLVGSEYNLRREQCEAAARHCGVKALRDLDLPTLASRANGFDATVYRRARHVITENARTVEAAQALAANHLPRLGELMAQSHVSMRDDFEITVPALDQLVALLQSVIGTQGGARMTGGGFGGCAVALLPQSMVATVREAVARHYRSPEGAPGVVHVCRATSGVEALTDPVDPR